MKNEGKGDFLKGCNAVSLKRGKKKPTALVGGSRRLGRLHDRSRRDNENREELMGGR